MGARIQEDAQYVSDASSVSLTHGRQRILITINVKLGLISPYACSRACSERADESLALPVCIKNSLAHVRFVIANNASNIG